MIDLAGLAEQDISIRLEVTNNDQSTVEDVTTLSIDRSAPVISGVEALKMLAAEVVGGGIVASSFIVIDGGDGFSSASFTDLLLLRRHAPAPLLLPVPPPAAMVSPRAR